MIQWENIKTRSASINVWDFSDLGFFSCHSIQFHFILVSLSSLKTPWNLAVGILSIQWRQFVLLLFKDSDYDDVKDWTISRFHGVCCGLAQFFSTFSFGFHWNSLRALHSSLHSSSSQLDVWRVDINFNVHMENRRRRRSNVRVTMLCNL